MNLLDVLHQYFNYIVNTTEFAIAIDSTGFYMFTTMKKSQDLIELANKYLDALCLTKEQCVLAFVTDKSDHDYDSFSFETSSLGDFVYEVAWSDLEAFVRKFAGKRSFTFTEEIIESIIDCFYDVPEYISELEAQLMDLGVSREVAFKIYQHNPTTTQEVFDLGCPDPLVDDVYNLVLEWYKLKTPDEPLNDAAYQSIVSSVKLWNTYALVCCCAGVFFLSFRYWAPGALKYLQMLSIVFAFMSTVFGSRSRKVKSNVLGQFAEAFGYVLIIAQLVPYLIKGTVAAISYLRSIEVDFSWKEFFNGLHF